MKSLLLLVSAVLLLQFIVLPRLAHRWFLAGKYRRSKALFQWLEKTQLTTNRRIQGKISVISNRIALGQFSQGLKQTREILAFATQPAHRAALLNNQAIALMKSRANLESALVSSAEAHKLFPENPFLLHTYALALHENGYTEGRKLLLSTLMKAPAHLRETYYQDLAEQWVGSDPRYAAQLRQQSEIQWKELSISGEHSAAEG